MAGKEMSPEVLGAMLGSQKADALAALQSARLSIDRERAEDYYLGDMRADMPAQEGRSRAVSSDVADTIEGLMPSLMDIFCSSDEVVKFEPAGADDEAAAQQETDYVNHVFMQQNPGFMVMYSFIKDSLLSKNGFVKIWWEKREQSEDETYYDLQDDQFAMLAQDVLAPDSGLEIVEHTERQEPGAPDPVSGQPGPPINLHDVKIVRTKTYQQAKVLGVPPEEFGIERSARTIADCNYCFHEVVTKSRAQLIAEGYDEDEVNALEDYNGTNNTEEMARDTVDEAFWAVSSANKSAQIVKITEHYVRMDYKGNGKADLYQVVTGGEMGQVMTRDGKMACEPCDVIPFASMTPVPITHRFFGRSIADLVMDIQRIKTALLRSLLDNKYLSNNPRVEVAESNAGPNTLDDLLVSRPGGVIRTKTVGGLNWQVVPDVSASTYPALEYMDTIKEMRTGVTRQGQGVDANALINQSATAVAQAFSASQAKMKLIARIFAETGVRDMFSLLHAVIRKHGQEAATFRVRKTWVQTDPRSWKTRNDMSVKVGLGDGGKAEQFAKMMGIANIQKEMLSGGKTNLVDDQKLYNSASAIVKISGYKNPDDFFNDPSEKNPDGSPKYPPPQPQPSPDMVKVQGQMQLEQQKQQHDQAKDQSQALIDQSKSQADIAAQDRKTQAEMIQTEREYQLKERLALLEAQLKERADQRAHEQHMLDMQHKRELHEHTLQKGTLGLIATAQSHDQKMAQAKEPA
jgi:hypothetical protein